jgi:hypothetical protein
VSELLAARLTGSALGVAVEVSFEESDCDCSGDTGAASGYRPVPLAYEAGEDASGPVDVATGRRTRIASLPLRPGGCSTFRLRAGSPMALPVARPNPFPPPAYPSTFVGRDELTSGSWTGMYGGAGYFLAAFDGPNQHVVSFPPWVTAVTQVFGPDSNGPWFQPPPANDTRALTDPRAPTGPRKIGQYSAPPPPESGWAPSFPIDVIVDPSRAPAGTTFQFAFYFCDYDARGRRQSVQLMDQATGADISPVQLLRDFEGGVYLVWQYARSVRMRINWTRGTNQVVSAVFFDAITP